jgi:hypothetical protein
VPAHHAGLHRNLKRPPAGVGSLPRLDRSRPGSSYVELRVTPTAMGRTDRGGVRAALDIGRGLAGGYELLVSSGVQRATQTLACFACTLRRPVPGGAIVEAGLRSRVGDPRRAAYQQAGSGELAAPRGADPELVREDSAVLGAALRRVLERLREERERSHSATARQTRRRCCAGRIGRR